MTTSGFLCAYLLKSIFLHLPAFLTVCLLVATNLVATLQTLKAASEPRLYPVQIRKDSNTPIPLRVRGIIKCISVYTLATTIATTFILQVSPPSFPIWWGFLISLGAFILIPDSLNIMDEGQALCLLSAINFIASVRGMDSPGMAITWAMASSIPFTRSFLSLFGSCKSSDDSGILLFCVATQAIFSRLLVLALGTVLPSITSGETMPLLAATATVGFAAFHKFKSQTNRPLHT